MLATGCKSDCNDKLQILFFVCIFFARTGAYFYFDFWRQKWHDSSTKITGNSKSDHSTAKRVGGHRHLQILARQIFTNFQSFLFVTPWEIFISSHSKTMHTCFKEPKHKNFAPLLIKNKHKNAKNIDIYLWNLLLFELDWFHWGKWKIEWCKTRVNWDF